MTIRPYLALILFLLSFYGLTNSSFAQFTDQQKLDAINRQDQIIRQEQEAEQREKRRREFEKIQKEEIF